MNELKFEVWIEVLAYLYNREFKHLRTAIISDISDDLHITYSHILEIIKLLKDKRLLSFKVTGRSKFIMLTDKGRLVSKYLTKARGLILK